MPKNAVFSAKMSAVLKFVNREVAGRESVFFLLLLRSFCRKAIRFPQRKMNIYTTYRFSAYVSPNKNYEQIEGTGVVGRSAVAVPGRTSVSVLYYLFRSFFLFSTRLSRASHREVFESQKQPEIGLVATEESDANMSSRRKIVF